MKEILKKHSKRIKILVFVCVFVFFIGKTIYDFAPLILIKNAFANTIDKYKSDFVEPFYGANLVASEMGYTQGDGSAKKIHAVFDSSVVGFSFSGPDSVYYTISLENIKKLLASDELCNLFLGSKKLSNTSKRLSLVPALLNLKVNEKFDVKFLEKTISNMNFKWSRGAFFQKEKSFSFSIPTEVIAEIIGSVFIYETDYEKNLKLKLLDFADAKDNEYLFKIKIYDNLIETIECVTHPEKDMSYIMRINTSGPEICFYIDSLNRQSEKNIFSVKSKIYKNQGGKTMELSIKSSLKDKAKEILVLRMTPDYGSEKSTYRLKSIYSLTVGELFEIGKAISDTL